MTLRVTALTYDVVWLTGASQVVPRRDTVVLGDFDCLLDGSTLTATPRGNYPSTEEAEAALDPYMRAWELELELDRRYRLEFRFTSCSSLAEGRDGGPTQHFLLARSSVSAVSSVALSVHATLPTPSGVYRSNPRVRQLVSRLRDLREGREKVTAAAWWIVTDFEHTYGNDDRGIAAQTLNVSSNLLGRVSRVASGQHPTEGRKVAKADPLTDADLDWLRRAVDLLVRRAAAVESGATGLPQLTLANV